MWNENKIQQMILQDETRKKKKKKTTFGGKKSSSYLTTGLLQVVYLGASPNDPLLIFQNRQVTISY